MSENVYVECYAGYRYAQEPRAFTWHGERHVVQSIEQAWRSPQGPGFLVEAADHARFVLIYDEAKDVWQVYPRPGIPHGDSVN